MFPRVLAAIVLLVVSLIVVAFGYLIGPRKQLWLIAGLDVTKLRQPDGLAGWVGTGLLSIGALDLLLSLAMFASAVDPPLLIIAYVVANVAGAAVVLIRMRRYLG